MRLPKFQPRFAAAFALAFAAAAASFAVFHHPRLITVPAPLAPLGVTVNVPQHSGGEANHAAAESAIADGAALMKSDRGEDYVHAIEAFLRPAVALDPQNVRARSLLALAYLRIHDNLEQGEETFRTITALLEPGPRPGSNVPYEYVVARVEYLRLLGRNEEAAELAGTTVQSVAHPELLYQLARSMEESSDFAGAQRTLAAALVLDSGNPRFRLLSAKLLRDTGKNAEADSAIESLALANPAYEPALVARAELFCARKSFADAARDLNVAFRTTALEPTLRERALKAAVATLIGLGHAPDALEFVALLTGDAALEAELSVRAAVPATAERAVKLAAARAQFAKSADFNALFELVKAVESDRNDSLGFTLLARAYEDRHDTYEAKDRYQKAIASPRGHEPEAVYRLARLELKRYDREAFDRTLAKATIADSADGRVAYLRAFYALQTHDPDSAEVNFRAAVSKLPRFTSIYVTLGDRAANQRDDKLAEYYYAAALRIDPAEESAVSGMASALFHLDSPARAVAFLKARLTKRPNDASLLTALALTYLRSGDQLNGKNYLQNAIRANPRYAMAFLHLGDLVRDEGNRQADYNAKRHSYRYALASYEMYSKLDPNDPDGYKDTADLYFDIRDLGAAAKNYHKVIELAPNYPSVHLRLAQIARNGGDIQNALALVKAEIQADPAGCDAAWVELGNMNMAQKDFQEAYRAFTEAVRLNPKNSDALFGLGVVHHLQGNYDNALAVFQRVQRLDPFKADVYWQMGLIYQKKGDIHRAQMAFVNYKGIVREPGSIVKADDKLRDLDQYNDSTNAPSRGLASAAVPHGAPAKPEVAEPPIPLFDKLHRNWLETDFLSGAPIAAATPATAPSGAKTFTNKEVEFDVPAGWECAEDHDAWVCRSTDAREKKEAVVVVAAVPADPGADSADLYIARLAKPRIYWKLSGESVSSEPKYVKRTDLSGQEWVDSLHLGSEVPGYYTRYLVTSRLGEALGVAFTVRSDRYGRYEAEMDRLVKSLRAYRKLRLEGNEKAENAPLDPAVPARVVVEGRFEDLPGAQQKVVEGAYAGILDAYGKRDFAAMKTDTAQVLALVFDYRDTRSYEAIAARGLAELAVEKARRENEDRARQVRIEVDTLEENGERVVACVEKHPEARDAIEPLIAGIFQRDPNNRTVMSWRSRLNLAALKDTLKTAKRRRPKKPPIADPSICDAEKLAAAAAAKSLRRPSSTR